MELYLTGVIAAFIFTFVLYGIQAIKRKILNYSNDSLFTIILGVIVGSLIASILSWFTVGILILMLFNGKVWGISSRNL